MGYYYDIPCEHYNWITAECAQKTCIRITKNSPPVQCDFCPQSFMNPVPKFAQDNFKEHCGASVLTDKATAMRYRDKFKNLGNFLYEGHIISETHGPLMYTSSNHHLNWFQYKHIDPVGLFGQLI